MVELIHRRRCDSNTFHSSGALQIIASQPRWHRLSPQVMRIDHSHRSGMGILGESKLVIREILEEQSCQISIFTQM